MRDRLATSRLFLLSVLIAVGIGFLVTKQLLDSRAAIWQRAQAANTNLVFTVSHVLENSLRELDLALQRTARHLADPAMQGLPPPLHEKVVIDHLLPRGSGEALVLDQAGQVIHSSRPLPAELQSFAEREYFTV